MHGTGKIEFNVYALSPSGLSFQAAEDSLSGTPDLWMELLFRWY
jgi:hypothetical protein